MAQLIAIRIRDMMQDVRIVIVDLPPSQIAKCGKPTKFWGWVMWC